MLTPQQIQQSRSQLSSTNTGTPGTSTKATTNWSDPNAFSATPTVQPVQQKQPGEGYLGEIPQIEAPFKATGTESTGKAIAKTVGNMPTDIINAGTGIINFLNPFGIAKKIGDTYKEVMDYSKQSGESPLSILGNSLKRNVTLEGQTGKGNAPDIIKAIAPDFITKIVQGDFQGAAKSIEEHPMTNVAPLVLAARGVAEGMGKGAEFDKAMTNTTNVAKETIKPITEPIKAGAEKVSDIVQNVRAKFNPIDQQAKTIIKETPLEEFNKYVEQGKKASLDPRELTPTEIAGTKAQGVLKDINSRLEVVGNEKANITKQQGKIDVSQSVTEARAGLRQDTPKLGLTFMKDGTLREAPGRLSKTTSSADIKLLQNTDSILSKAEAKKTLQATDDAIDSIQEMLYKRSKTIGAEPINTEIEGMIKSRIGELNGKVKEAGGPDYSALNDYYSRLTGMRNQLAQGLGKNSKSAGTLMDKLFSSKDANTKTLFDDIKTETGVDLAKESTIAKFVSEYYKEQAPESMLKGKFPTSKEGVTSKFIDWLGNKIGTDKLDQARQIIESQDKKSYTKEGLLNKMLPDYISNYLKK